MRKLSYILSFVLLSVTFLGCDKEPIDEIVTDDSIKGEAIVRFELNGVTYGARANEVVSTYDQDGSLSIAVYAKDENNDFHKITLVIVISSTEKGFYSANITSNVDRFTLAIIEYDETEWWEYSSFWENSLEIDTGSLTITEVNELSKQIEGYFSFELLPPPEEDLDLPEDTPYPSNIKIENGYFKYVNID